VDREAKPPDFPADKEACLLVKINRMWFSADAGPCWKTGFMSATNLL
jgi:hypothetical protein